MATKNEKAAQPGGKAILSLGYTRFVLDSQAAADLFVVLTNGTVEQFDDVWNSETKKSEPRVKPVDGNAITLRAFSLEDYALGKLLNAADQSNKE